MHRASFRFFSGKLVKARAWALSRQVSYEAWWHALQVSAPTNSPAEAARGEAAIKKVRKKRLTRDGV